MTNEEEIPEQEFEEDNVNELQGEPNKNFVDNIFDVEGRIELVSRTWRGEVPVRTNNGTSWVKKNREIAGDKFINKTVGAMRVIINESNIITRKNDKECRLILFRAVEAFIYDMVNEPTIHNRDYRTMAKSFEHNLELFLGLVEFGHGSKVATNISTGTNLSNETKKGTGMLGFLGLGGGK